MNIGIFTDTYFPQINGVATSVHLLEKELAALGHNVYIFTTTDPKALPAKDVYRMPSMPFAFLPSHRVGLLYPPGVLLKIRKLKLDIVHTHTEFPLGIFGKVVSEFLKIPLVHTYHTMWEDYVHYVGKGHIITPKMAQQFSKFFCNRARAVITPTEKSRDSLISYGVERPVRVIPTGIDFKPFDPKQYSEAETNALRKELGILPKDQVLLSLGRVAKEKSIDVIIKQMPEIIAPNPNVKLLIIGDGPARNDLAELSKKLNLESHIIFAGSRPWSEVGRYYQLGDIFVSASITETQGLTYVEAMAAHLPVIAKFDKSIEGLVCHNVTGYTFQNNEEFPGLVLDILSNAEDRQRIVNEALVSINHLSSKMYGQNVQKMYKEVVSAYPKPDSQRKAVRLKIKK